MSETTNKQKLLDLTSLIADCEMLVNFANLMAEDLLEYFEPSKELSYELQKAAIIRSYADSGLRAGILQNFTSRAKVKISDISDQAEHIFHETEQAEQ